MPANTGDNVILDLGMRVDSTGAQADIQDVVDYIRDTIKEDFNIDIRAGNLNDLRQQLNALGGDLRLVKDDATGMTTAVQASFKTANGEAVRLRAAVEAVNGAYQLVDGTDISARVTAGASELQKLNERLIQQQARLAQAALDGNATEINSINSQIQRTQSLIQQKQRQLTIMQRVADVAELEGRQTDISAQIVEHKDDFITFAENINNANTALRDFQRTQQQAFAAVNMNPLSQVYQDIQTNLQTSFAALQTYVDQFNAAITNTGGQGQAVFQRLADGSIQLESTYQGNNQALQTMSNNINNVGRALRSAFARQSDVQSDNQAIQNAITLYRQYRDAVLVVERARASGRAATQQETDAVNQSRAAYEQAEQAILSNGEAIRQNATYNRDKNQVTRDSIQALKEYEASLNSTNNSMAGSIAQMIQMKLGFEGLQEAIRNVYETAKDLNDAMTDIQLVTQQSNSDATDLIKSYAGLAQEMGTTTAEVAASADEWLRQGKTVEQTYNLVKASSSLAIIGQMDAADATTALTAAINGYAMSSDEAMGIVDKLTQLDLEFAASSGDIATAMSKVASVASQGGVSLEKLMAILTVTEDQTQQSADTIGNAWNSIFQRMSKIAAGKDVSDTGASLNDVDKVLKKMNISLKDSGGQIRDLGDVLDEVASKWNTFSRNEQNQISTAIAGEMCA